jgi:hypothetical protein
MSICGVILCHKLEKCVCCVRVCLCVCVYVCIVCVLCVCVCVCLYNIYTYKQMCKRQYAIIS